MFREHPTGKREWRLLSVFSSQDERNTESGPPLFAAIHPTIVKGVPAPSAFLRVGCELSTNCLSPNPLPENLET